MKPLPPGWEYAGELWTRGDWMQTHSGGRFYPALPESNHINPADVAHALSMLCRYGGHIDRFYSVAEHCVLMSLAVSPENALSALLHDATEAYVVDIPKPVKLLLPDYQALEARVWSAIVRRFSDWGLTTELPAEVHEADKRILVNERSALFSRAEPWYLGVEALPVTVSGWEPAYAEERYLNRLGQLLS